MLVQITAEACKSCARLPVAVSVFRVKKKGSAARMAPDNLLFDRRDTFQITYVLSSSRAILDLQSFTGGFWSSNSSASGLGIVKCGRRSCFSLSQFPLNDGISSVAFGPLIFSNNEPETNAGE